MVSFEEDTRIDVRKSKVALQTEQPGIVVTYSRCFLFGGIFNFFLTIRVFSVGEGADTKEQAGQCALRPRKVLFSGRM